MTVSVILPVYNAAKTLDRCLRSLEAQTFRDFRIIAVDDGSTDGSAKILADWSARLPMDVTSVANGGAAKARNLALSKADGEFVYMMDADDFIHPRTFELAVGAVRSAAADFVLFGYEEVSAGEAGAARERMFSAELDVRPETMPVPPLRHYEEKVSMPVIWHFLYRRSSLDGMRFPEGIMYEDNVFVYEYLSRAVRGVRIPAKLYGYVQEPESVMHATDASRRLHSMDVVMRELSGRLSREDWKWLFRRRYVMVVKTLWREGASKPELRGTVRAWFRDGVVDRKDFPLRWRLRFLFALGGNGNG